MAANSNTVQLVLKVKDDGSVVIDQLAGKLDQFGKQAEQSGSRMSSAWAAAKGHWLALTAAISAALYTMKDMTEAYMAQENAEKKLEIAMKNVGDYTDAGHKSLVGYAEALQMTTTYADDVTLATMANLKTFGMNTEELKRATEATLDLASAKGMDLFAASELVGKAFVGETGTLSRYGIIIDDNVERSKKFEAVLNLINQRFGGSAQAELETYAGQVKFLANQFDDLKETLGLGVLKAIQAVLGAIAWLTTGFLQSLSYMESGLAKFYGLLGKIPGNFGEFFKNMEAAARESAEMYSGKAAGAMEFSMRSFEAAFGGKKASARGNVPGGGGTAGTSAISDEERKALEERLKIEQKMRDEIAQFGMDRYDREVYLLNREVEEYRKAKVNEALITQYYAGRMAEIEKARDAERIEITGRLQDQINQFGMDRYQKEVYALNMEVEAFRKAKVDEAVISEYYAGKMVEIERSANEEKQNIIKKMHETIDLSGKNQYERAVYLLNQEVEAFRKAKISEGEITEYYAARMKEITEQYGKKVVSVWDDVNASLSRSLEAGFFDLFKGGISDMEDAWRKFCDMMIQSFARSLAQMMTNWILFGNVVGNNPAGAGAGGSQMSGGGLLGGIESIFKGLAGSLFGGIEKTGGGGGGAMPGTGLMNLGVGMAPTGASAAGNVGFFGQALTWVKSLWPFQEGGWIPEPVIGRGISSGRYYSFAEREPEMIVPRKNIKEGAAPSPSLNARIINVLDPSIVGDFLATDAGEQVILNVVKRNQRALGVY